MRANDPPSDDRVVATELPFPPDPAAWPDPTPEMLDDPRFNAIWGVIRTWDIHVPGLYDGYMGTMGNHARAILEALEATDAKP
jgi:hypothetical protein